MSNKPSYAYLMSEEQRQNCISTLEQFAERNKVISFCQLNECSWALINRSRVIRITSDTDLESYANVARKYSFLKMMIFGGRYSHLSRYGRLDLIFTFLFVVSLFLPIV